MWTNGKYTGDEWYTITKTNFVGIWATYANFEKQGEQWSVLPVSCEDLGNIVMNELKMKTMEGRLL